MQEPVVATISTVTVVQISVIDHYLRTVRVFTPTYSHQLSSPIGPYPREMFVYSALKLYSFVLQELTTNVLAVFLSVLLLVRLLQLFREARSLPPGPWGLPVLGSLPFLKGDLHLHFRDLTHKYGSLISTRLGSQLFVVMSDPKMIRDAFRKEEFTGRPTTEFTNLLGGYGES